MSECIVVGGGAAGLSAALVLGRARRRTLLIDASEQTNRVAEGVGGLLGHDRRPAAELYRLGRQELSAYPAAQLPTHAGAGSRGGSAHPGPPHRQQSQRAVAHRRHSPFGQFEHQPPRQPTFDANWARRPFGPLCDDFVGRAVRPTRLTGPFLR